jgi:hypothetical protein
VIDQFASCGSPRTPTRQGTPQKGNVCAPPMGGAARRLWAPLLPLFYFVLSLMSEINVAVVERGSDTPILSAVMRSTDVAGATFASFFASHFLARVRATHDGVLEAASVKMREYGVGSIEVPDMSEKVSDYLELDLSQMIFTVALSAPRPPRPPAAPAPLAPDDPSEEVLASGDEGGEKGDELGDDDARGDGPTRTTTRASTTLSATTRRLAPCACRRAGGSAHGRRAPMHGSRPAGERVTFLLQYVNVSVVGG